MYVIKQPKEISFNGPGITGKIFPSEHLTPRLRYVLVETEKGHETVIIERISDFIYYILEGKGYYVIDGKKENCQKGDLVVIPAGKKFTYKGKMKMLLVSTPPWTPEQEETLE